MGIIYPCNALIISTQIKKIVSIRLRYTFNLLKARLVSCLCLMRWLQQQHMLYAKLIAVRKQLLKICPALISQHIGFFSRLSDICQIVTASGDACLWIKAFQIASTTEPHIGTSDKWGIHRLRVLPVAMILFQWKIKGIRYVILHLFIILIDIFGNSLYRVKLVLWHRHIVNPLSQINLISQIPIALTKCCSTDYKKLRLLSLHNLRDDGLVHIAWHSSYWKIARLKAILLPRQSRRIARVYLTWSNHDHIKAVLWLCVKAIYIFNIAAVNGNKCLWYYLHEQ